MTKTLRLLLTILAAIVAFGGLAYAAGGESSTDTARLAVGIVAAVLAIAVAVVHVLDKRLEGMLAQVEARLDRRFTAHRAPCEWRFTRLGFPMHDVPTEEE